MNKKILYGMAILTISLMMVTPNIAGVLAPAVTGVVYQQIFYGNVNARFTLSSSDRSMTDTAAAMATIIITVYDDNTVEIVFLFPDWEEVYTGKIRIMVDRPNYMFIAAQGTGDYEGLITVRMFMRITPAGLDLKLYAFGFFFNYAAPAFLNAPIENPTFYTFTYTVRQAPIAT